MLVRKETFEALKIVLEITYYYEFHNYLIHVLSKIGMCNLIRMDLHTVS